VLPHVPRIRFGLALPTYDGSCAYDRRPGILRRVTEVHRRLGLATGVTHAEFRLTAKGIRLVEVNARLAGDMIPLLVRLAIGTDVPRVAAALACGQAQPAPAEAGAGCAAVRFIYPWEHVVVQRVHEPLGMESWTRLARWEVGAGADVRLPPEAFMSRLGHVVVVGDTPRECQSRLDVADQAMRGLIEFAPREHPVSAR
jgi:biotin carboxylase